MATKKQDTLTAEIIQPKVVVKPTKYLVTLSCDSMLMNKMPDMSQKKSSRKDQAKVDHLELEYMNWREKLYTNGDYVVIPGENIHQCLQDGAKYWGQKIPGEGNKTYVNVLKCAVICEEGRTGLKKDDETNILPYGKNVNGTPTKPSSAMVYKIRPILKGFRIQFLMHVFDSRLDPDILNTILTFAGTFIGIGDWRPTFGRFNVERIEVV